MPMPADLVFRFEGQAVPARPGQSLAAALTQAGVRSFRKTARGSERGIFCGMGVCQDCLVTVDGEPSQRACMTMAKARMEVERQAALPSIAGAAPVTPPPLTIDCDVLVVGGGAGGLNAAIAAAEAGASVTVLDERKIGGGQYFKQAAEGISALDAQQAKGAALLARARDAGAEILGEVEIWGAFDGPLILAQRHGGALVARPRQLIVATGAYERPVMVPGWTLPGVMTTGAAQTLWRSYRTLPGARVAVCGSGPLNLQVAAELAAGGAEIAMVAESAPAPWTRPLEAAAMAAADPALALKGLRMIAGLKRRSVEIAHASRLVRVERERSALRAVVATPSGERRLVVDALLMNDGFQPQNEILRLLGAKMSFDARARHLRADRDADGRTSVANLFAVGDCAGLGGAPAAVVEGRVAGLAAAVACGRSSGGTDAALLATLERHRRFQRRLWTVYAPAAPAPPIPDETIVCRCEEVSCGEMREAMSDDISHVGSIKRATRLGMGRCQGRYCGPAAVAILSEKGGSAVADHAFFAPRVPIKPVAISAIVAAEEAVNAGE